MNVCFISPCQFNEFTGGIDRVCCQLIRELLKQGIQISSFYLNRSENDVESGVKYRQFPCSTAAASKENIKFLRDFVLEEKVDIVWLHTYVHDQFECARHAVKGTCARLVYTFHNDPRAPLVDLVDTCDFYKTCYLLERKWSHLISYLHSLVKYPIGYFFRRRRLCSIYNDIAEHCDLVTFLSDRAAIVFSLLAKKALYTRLVKIYNPVDTCVAGRYEKKKQLLYVGRLVWHQKRLDRLMKAWKKLQPMYSDWSLVIVGGGTDEKLYRSLARYLNLQNMSFEGATPSTEYFKTASVICVPSSHEGFCLVAFEGIANSCTPVFFDSLHPLVELLGREHSVKSWSVDYLAQTLSVAMQRFEKNKHSPFNGIDVLNKLTPEKIANKYIKEFQKLIR